MMTLPKRDPQKRLTVLQQKHAHLEERIGYLMSQRVEVEEAIADVHTRLNLDNVSGGPDDLSRDAEILSGAGFGTDEDYRFFDGQDDF